MYTACAAFRLARFNVQIGVVDKRYFIGVASPLAALIIVSLVWVGRDFPELYDIREIGTTNPQCCDYYCSRIVDDFQY